MKDVFKHYGYVKFTFWLTVIFLGFSSLAIAGSHAIFLDTYYLPGIDAKTLIAKNWKVVLHSANITILICNILFAFIVTAFCITFSATTIFLLSFPAMIIILALFATLHVFVTSSAKFIVNLIEKTVQKEAECEAIRI